MTNGLAKTFKIIPPAISSAGVYYFTTDLGVQYEVRFGRRQDKILHATIVFGVINDEYGGEEYTVTNKGELYEVMATLVEVIRMFMIQHPSMVEYEFTGIARDGEDESKQTGRIALYKRYLPIIFNVIEWTFDYSGLNTVIVNRIKKND